MLLRVTPEKLIIQPTCCIVSKLPEVRLASFALEYNGTSDLLLGDRRGIVFAFSVLKSREVPTLISVPVALPLATPIWRS